MMMKGFKFHLIAPAIGLSSAYSRRDFYTIYLVSNQYWFSSADQKVWAYFSASRLGQDAGKWTTEQMGL